MKKIFLIFTIVLLTSFKPVQNDLYLNFNYEVKYLVNNKECSVFVSNSNSKDFLFITYIGNDEYFKLMRNDKLFNVIFSFDKEINYDRTRFSWFKSELTKVVETNEIKKIGDLICTKFIGETRFKSHTIEVYIAKNHKINNTNFLLSEEILINPNINGLVVEINITENLNKKMERKLSFQEFKKNEKSLKFNDQSLNKLIKLYNESNKRTSSFSKNNGDVEMNVTVDDEERFIENKYITDSIKKFKNIAEKNHKSFKFKEGKWIQYAEKNFNFKPKDSIKKVYNFTAECVVSQKGVITKISNVKPEEYKEEYTKFLKSIKDKWIPCEEYGEKIECTHNIFISIEK